MSEETKSQTRARQAFISMLSIPRPVKPLVAPPIAKMMSLKSIDKWYERAKAMPGEHFVDQILNVFDINIDLPRSDLEKIPAEGPLVVLSNHPFGGIEGIILASVIRKVRKDIKIIASNYLNIIPELEELFFLVDPSGKKKAKLKNINSMKKAIRWVQDGGVLGIFPAGVVSHLQIRQISITDGPWQESVGRFINRVQTPVLPVYFAGANGMPFQILSFIHPMFRAMRLPSELINKRHITIALRIGNPVMPKQWKDQDTSKNIIMYFRKRTYNLAHREDLNESPAMQDQLELEPVAEAIPQEKIIRDIEQLPESQTLHTKDKYKVFYAEADQIPNLLYEIGRQREITFRQAKEGSGKTLDIDHFDNYYKHLVVWDTNANRLVGSYRLGQGDEILEKYGKEGFYTHSLFLLKKKFLKKITPALEMGRSFVTPEYQRDFNSLMLLWRGIGAFVVRNPRYRYLIGPVSISNDYTPYSQRLLLDFLEQQHGNKKMSRRVKPTNPPLKESSGSKVKIEHFNELEEMIADIESKPMGVPVLIRQYLKLGAEFIAFNRDPLFGDCIDGLIVVDLPKTETKILNRYLGKEGRESYIKYWEEKGLK